MVGAFGTDLSAYLHFPGKEAKAKLAQSNEPSTPVMVPIVSQAAASKFTMPNLGILDDLLLNPGVHDILVNGTKPIYIDTGDSLRDSGFGFSTHEEVAEVAQKIMQSVGQFWSPERPIIDTRLPDGSRVNMIGPPMSLDGITISIRKFSNVEIRLDDMVARGQMSYELAAFCQHCARLRLNLIVSGGSGTGKTTLLNAISGAINPKERIVTIEDSAELRLQQPHVVRLESKSAEGSVPAVTIRDLIKNALRMRPDRIIVGESRGEEALDMLQAMNTGHDGSMTSLHANSPRDALSRLEMMVSLGMPQLPTRLVRQQIASAVNLIIQMGRDKDGTRRITQISEVSGMEGETIVMQDLITFNEASKTQPAQYRWSGSAPRHPHVTEAARASEMLRGMR